MTVLLPSLRAAQSTARILGDGRKAERQQWHPVDDEILSLLSEQLLLLESASSGESGAIDTWTEGEAACELLRGMIPVIMSIR